MEKTLAVRVEKLTKHYASGEKPVAVLEDVDLEVEEGAFFAIVGPSGSGKTSLLNIIGGLDVPSAGRVEVCGLPLSTLREEQRARFRRENLGFVFQFYNLLPTLSAAENVKVGLELLSLPRAETDRRAEEYLCAVGLAGKAHRLPAQLSGGEQQRVAIARALAKQPRLVLSDEPTGNLDGASAREVLSLMQKLNRTLGTTLIVVTHDPQIADLADGAYHVGRQATRTSVLVTKRALP